MSRTRPPKTRCGSILKIELTWGANERMYELEKSHFQQIRRCTVGGITLHAPEKVNSFKMPRGHLTGFPYLVSMKTVELEPQIRS